MRHVFCINLLRGMWVPTYKSKSFFEDIPTRGIKYDSNKTLNFESKMEKTERRHE